MSLLHPLRSSVALRILAISRFPTFERIGDGLKGAVAYGRLNRHRTAHRRHHRPRHQHPAQVALTSSVCWKTQHQHRRLPRKAACTDQWLGRVTCAVEERPLLDRRSRKIRKERPWVAANRTKNATVECHVIEYTWGCGSSRSQKIGRLEYKNKTAIAMHMIAPQKTCRATWRRKLINATHCVTVRSRTTMTPVRQFG